MWILLLCYSYSSLLRILLWDESEYREEKITVQDTLLHWMCKFAVSVRNRNVVSASGLLLSFHSVSFLHKGKKKKVKNQQKYLPLHWSAWKNFGFCSSHRIFQNDSPQLMDLKTAEHWQLCIKAHVQVSWSMYLRVLQDQG